MNQPLKPILPSECETCNAGTNTPGFNCNCCWIKPERDAYFDSPEVQHEIWSLTQEAIGADDGC